MPLLPTSVLSLALAAAPAAAAEHAIYQAATARIDESYLHLDDFDAVAAFTGAAHAAEDAVPWLLVEQREGDRQVEIVLAHGDTGPFATVAFPHLGTLAELPDALAALEDAIAAHATDGGSSALDPDLDLPVELLRGMAGALDRHSVVLAGERLDAFNERIRGRLVGIGCRIVRQDAGMVVRDIFPDGPADLGGLRSGDLILRVDGVSTAGMELEEVVERIRGDKGEALALLLLRVDPETGEERELALTLVRDEVRIPNVEWARTEGGAGWIRIDHFSQQTARLMEDALADLAQDPAATGLVLDLRGNSGGSMLQAAKVVDLFVDQGVILQTGGRGFEKVSGLVQSVQAWPGGAESTLPALSTDAPLVVLMDPDSASASEIVAGALSLLSRAVLVGEHSHGKGTVQQPFLLREASPGLGEVKLKLTIAEYHLAEDTPVLEGLGLAPDVATEVVELSRAGVTLPATVTRGEALGLVVEDPGWREGSSPAARGDLLLEVAEHIALTAQGPTRGETLQAAAIVAADWRVAEGARLEEAMAARGIDWSGDDLCRSPCPAPDLAVSVELDGPARAGDTVTVRARVRNLGPAPVHRAVVRLTAGAWRLPWHGLTIPIGFVPPGEEGAGEAVVELPMQGATRQDLVAVTVEADRRPAVGAEPVLLELAGEPPPAVAVEVRGVSAEPTAPDEPGLMPVEVVLRNPGPESLTGLQVRLLHPEDPRLELVDREQRVARLAPGASATVRLRLRWTGAAPPTVAMPVPLQVEAERHGSLVEALVPVRWTGPVASLLPPRVMGEVPLSSPQGELPVRMVVSDDQGIESVTAWWRGDKVAWRSGGSQDLDLDLDLEVVDGTQALVVDVTDLEGVTTRRRWYLRAAPESDGTASP